jgi:hypothetical protein
MQLVLEQEQVMNMKVRCSIRNGFQMMNHS